MIATEEVLLKDQISEIEDRAERELTEVFGSELTLPVNVNLVAGHLGLQIKQGKFKSSDISGFYDRATSTIYISEDDPYYRQAFTVAHEIGHHVLHQDTPEETFFRHSERDLLDPQLRPRESEANWFAASLLMPRRSIDEFWFLYPGDVSKMASIFAVSPTAMQFRLKNLGLVS